MQSIQQILLYIYVLNINILQLYFWYTKLVYLKSAKVILYFMYMKQLSRNSAEVQLKIFWTMFDCAEVKLLQVNFRHTLNILHLN